MENKSNNRVLILLGLLLFALVALSGYLYTNLNNKADQISELNAQQKELEIANTELNEQYDESIANLDALRSDNKDLNELIEKQKEMLRVQKNKISNYIWTKKELGKAREEIQLLNDQLNGYLAEINRLKTENTSLQATNSQLNNSNIALTNTNTTLRSENTSLASSVQKERSEKQQVIKEKKIVEEKAAELSAENVKLNNTVDIASAIKVKYVEVKGFDVNEDGSVRTKKRRAKNINTLQICFVVNANVVNKEENPRFHFRFVGPKGQTLLDNVGSGIITDKIDGSKVRYTKSGTIKYKGEQDSACLDWRPQNKLEKGEYLLEIYNNGFKVSESNFKLK